VKTEYPCEATEEGTWGAGTGAWHSKIVAITDISDYFHCGQIGKFLRVTSKEGCDFE
jgi:hypothetical protein